jgi:hypothetical protein
MRTRSKMSFSPTDKRTLVLSGRTRRTFLCGIGWRCHFSSEKICLRRMTSGENQGRRTWNLLMVGKVVFLGSYGRIILTRACLRRIILTRACLRRIILTRQALVRTRGLGPSHGWKFHFSGRTWDHVSSSLSHVSHGEPGTMNHLCLMGHRSYVSCVIIVFV